MNKEELKKRVIESPIVIRNIENPDEELQLIAVRKNGTTIKYIKNPSFDVKKEAVINNALSIEYIENPEEEIQVLAVTALWNSIKYINNPTENTIKAALDSKGWAIQYINEPSKEQMIIAVEKDYDSIKYIKNPPIEVQLKAINNYWAAIKYINNPDLKVRRRAIELNPESIHYIDFSVEELDIFIEDNINVLKYAYDSVDIDNVVEVLKRKFSLNEVSKEYVEDFMKIEILEMDKINFIKDYASKEVKKMLVDYELSV